MTAIVNADGELAAGTYSTMDDLLAVVGAASSTSETDPTASGVLMSFLKGMVANTAPIPYANYEANVSAEMTGTTATAVKAAPTGGDRFCITEIVIANTSSTVTNVEIISGSTVIAVFPAAADGGGAAHSFFFPLPVDTKLDARCVTTGAAVTVTAVGYMVPA